MKLYDSYTTKLVEIKEEDISIYNCGPTVYNHIHIGNARPLISMDVLYRYFKKHKKNVNYVLNITDIDDKIINKAIEENKFELDVSNYFLNEYQKIKQSLNILEMTNPKVSDHIQDIINYIAVLVKNNSGYIVGDDVYFDTKSVSNYGELSKHNIEKDIAGIRIEVNENKRNPNDFILWKKTQKGITWDTPWGKGRPGWHSECSCLINKYLGKQVTIHGGGVDLKFPHHENENAQNNAIYNVNLSKVWMHFGLVNINNQKMSKSLNNFILVKDLLKQYDYKVLRWFFYQADYKQPLNFSDEILEQNIKNIKKIEKSITLSKNYLHFNDLLNKITTITKLDEVDQYFENDLDFVSVVDYVYKLIKELNSLIKDKKNKYEVLDVISKLFYVLDILGIQFNDIHTKENLELLNKWKQEVENKNFTNADEIRNELILKGLM